MRFIILRQHRKIKYLLAIKTTKLLSDLDDEFYDQLCRSTRSAYLTDDEKYLEKFCNYLVKKYKAKILTYEEYNNNGLK